MVNRFTLAGLLTVLSIFALGVLVFSVADGSEPAPIEAEATTPPSPVAAAPAEPTATATAAPKAAATPLQAAAKAAGCELKSPPNEGQEHVPQPTTIADYGSNPPTSGVHAPEPAPVGIYDRKSAPDLEFTVHSLEHGRINVQYAEDVPDATVEKLAKFVEDTENGYHLLLFQNQTNMPYAVAATAWDHLIGCETFNAKTLAALGVFWKTYVDKAPEFDP